MREKKSISERDYIKIRDSNSRELIYRMREKNDTNSLRIQRLLNFPDLSRKKNSPINLVINKIIDMPRFKDFDVIDIPEIVSVEYNFDLLNTPIDHPSREKTDTYYINKSNVLRTHTTAMWSFYLKDSKIIKKLNENDNVKCLSFGRVFRKDEIDRNHFPIFHQIDGLYICKKSMKVIEIKDLNAVLTDITKNIYGDSVKYRFLKDVFPFTDPSTQIEIKKGSDWLEVLGAGIVHEQVLSNFNLDPSIYNGWAFGFGIERLSMAKMNIPDIRIFWSNDERITSQLKDLNNQYKEISRFPMIYRDISFILDEKMNLNNYYEIIRDYGKNLIESVNLIDKYKNQDKLGKNKISYTFRIIYRSHERTLTNKEVNEIQEKIREKTRQKIKAVLR